MQPSPIIFLRKIATFDPWRTQKSLRKHEHPITGNSFVETSLIKGKRTKVNLHLLYSVLVNPLNLRNVWDENRRYEESHSLKQVSENKGGKFLKKTDCGAASAGEYHKVIWYYHINYGVIQGFPALRKAVTTHVKKYDIFSRVFDIANQLLTRHLPFAPLGQVDEWTAKPSPFLIQRRLSESFRIMVAKTPKNPYRLQTGTFKLS